MMLSLPANPSFTGSVLPKHSRYLEVLTRGPKVFRPKVILAETRTSVASSYPELGFACFMSVSGADGNVDLASFAAWGILRSS